MKELANQPTVLSRSQLEYMVHNNVTVKYMKALLNLFLNIEYVNIFYLLFARCVL